MTTAEIMDVEHSPLIEKAKAMEMLGETPAEGFAGFATKPGNVDQLAERVFAMQLPGEHAAVAETLAKPGAFNTMKVTEVTSEDHLGD
jgi:hypothetical protein